MRHILYSGTKNASSWAMRAWLALREANVQFDEIVVDIRRPQRFKNLAKIAEFSPPAAVPVLMVDKTAIFDSLAIMEYANDYANGSLLPIDRLQRGQARAFMAWQHSGLSNICPRLSFESAFYPDKRGLSPQETEQTDVLYSIWEQSLNKNGGLYLFGSLSLADLNFVPTVIRLTRHHAVPNKFPLTMRWVEELLQRPTIREWLDEADTLPPIWYDEYLLPPTLDGTKV